jgi:hypothetical protein
MCVGKEKGGKMWKRRREGYEGEGMVQEGEGGAKGGQDLNQFSDRARLSMEANGLGTEGTYGVTIRKQK